MIVVYTKRGDRIEVKHGADDTATAMPATMILGRTADGGEMPPFKLTFTTGGS